MADQLTQVRLTLEGGAECDTEYLADLTHQLRQELLELEVEAVDLVRDGEIPAGAKAGDPITWGSLLLAFASGGGLAALIGLLQTWLIRNDQSSVTMKIGDDELTVTGRPTAQQQQVIDNWLNRHKGFLIADG